MSWVLGFTANAVIAVAYFALFALIYRGLSRALAGSDVTTKGMRGMLSLNPLALATSFIFLSCGLGHANHAIHAIMPSLGMEGVAMVAAQVHFSAPQIWIVDIFTALVAIWYFLLRNRLPGILHGSSMYEDMLKRREQALDIQDSIAQGLAQVKLSLQVGDEAQAIEHATKTMDNAQRIISDLLGSEASTASMKPGRLRRKEQ